jgi:hypothetical protein
MEIKNVMPYLRILLLFSIALLVVVIEETPVTGMMVVA